MIFNSLINSVSVPIRTEFAVLFIYFVFRSSSQYKTSVVTELCYSFVVK